MGMIGSSKLCVDVLRFEQFTLGQSKLKLPWYPDLALKGREQGKLVLGKTDNPGLKYNHTDYHNYYLSWVIYLSV